MAATVFLPRRGSTSQMALFTGQPAELTVDTTKSVVVMHDGIVPGGYPLLREDFGNVNPATAANSLIALRSMSNVSPDSIAQLGIAYADLNNMTNLSSQGKSVILESITPSDLDGLGAALVDMSNVSLSAVLDLGVAAQDMTNVNRQNVLNLGIASSTLAENTDILSYIDPLANNDLSNINWDAVDFSAMPLLNVDGSNAASISKVLTQSLRNLVINGNFSVNIGDYVPGTPVSVPVNPDPEPLPLYTGWSTVVDGSYVDKTQTSSSGQDPIGSSIVFGEIFSDVCDWQETQFNRSSPSITAWFTSQTYVEDGSFQINLISENGTVTLWSFGPFTEDANNPGLWVGDNPLTSTAASALETFRIQIISGTSGSYKETTFNMLTLDLCGHVSPYEQRPITLEKCLAADPVQMVQDETERAIAAERALQALGGKWIGENFPNYYMSLPSTVNFIRPSNFDPVGYNNVEFASLTDLQNADPSPSEGDVGIVTTDWRTVTYYLYTSGSWVAQTPDANSAYTYLQGVVSGSNPTPDPNDWFRIQQDMPRGGNTTQWVWSTAVSQTQPTFNFNFILSIKPRDFETDPIQLDETSTVIQTLLSYVDTGDSISTLLAGKQNTIGLTPGFFVLRGDPTGSFIQNTWVVSTSDSYAVSTDSEIYTAARVDALVAASIGSIPIGALPLLPTNVGQYTLSYDGTNYSWRNQQFQETDLTPQITGSNTVFNISSLINNTCYVQVFFNGLKQRATNFTINYSALTLTLGFTPATTDALEIVWV